MPEGFTCGQSISQSLWAGVFPEQVLEDMIFELGGIVRAPKRSVNVSRLCVGSYGEAHWKNLPHYCSPAPCVFRGIRSHSRDHVTRWTILGVSLTHDSTVQICPAPNTAGLKTEKLNTDFIILRSGLYVAHYCVL